MTALPILLALLGTALMAVAIFAPKRAAAVTAVSFAPPAWPSLVDPRAASCDAGARLALVDALAVVRAPWGQAILQRASEDEPDPLVRAAIRAALAAA